MAISWAMERLTSVRSSTWPRKKWRASRSGMPSTVAGSSSSMHAMTESAALSFLAAAARRNCNSRMRNKEKGSVSGRVAALPVPTSTNQAALSASASHVSLSDLRMPKDRCVAADQSRPAVA